MIFFICTKGLGLVPGVASSCIFGILEKNKWIIHFYLNILHLSYKTYAENLMFIFELSLHHLSSALIMASASPCSSLGRVALAPAQPQHALIKTAPSNGFFGVFCCLAAADLPLLFGIFAGVLELFAVALLMCYA